MTSRFRHNTCGGDLTLDVAGLYFLKSPSLSITPNGITIESVEITAKESGGMAQFVCRKCRKEVEVEDSKNILTLCLVCQKYHPINTIKTCNEVSSICENCLELLQQKSDKSELPEYITSIKRWLVLPSTIKLITISHLLQKKIIV